MCREQQHHPLKGWASNWHNWLLFYNPPQLRPCLVHLERKAAASLPAQSQTQPSGSIPELPDRLHLACEEPRGGTDCSTALQPGSVCACARRHICTLQGLVFVEPHYQKARFCCAPLLCLCQLCSLLSNASLCRVSAQLCSRYISTVRLFCSSFITHSSPLSLWLLPQIRPL